MSPIVIFSAVCSLVLIWICSGILLQHVQHLTSSLRLPSFSFSVLLLGMLTSIPEFAVAINSVIMGTPEVSLGNLIGGQVILLLIVIPLLALSKRGLRMRYPLTPKTIGVTIATNAVPFIALLNGFVSVPEAIGMLLLFFLFSAIFITDLEQEHVLLAKKKERRTASTSVSTMISLGLIILCMVVIFIASHQLVSTVRQFALWFGFHPFFVSLIVVSLGTNIPEIILAIRSVMNKKPTIALGDYIGSATTNTLIAGLVVMSLGGVRVSMLTVPLLVPIAGFILFWVFARSRRILSAKEALILILIALLFFVASSYVEVGS